MARVTPKFLNLNDALTMSQISTPSNPASGKNKLYFKSDGNLYELNSSGVENIVGPGMSGSDWKNDLTWTTAAFGSITNLDVRYRRVGDSMEVSGQFTAGTTTGSTAAIILPTGYTLDTSKIGSSATFEQLGQLVRVVNTGSYAATNSGPFVLFSDGSTSDRLFISYSPVSSSFEKGLGDSQIGSGNGVAFMFTIPISGWSVNNGTNSPTPSMRAYNSSTTISSSLATINYTTTDYDNASGYSAGIYTVNQAGKFQVNASLLIAGTISLNNTLIMEIQKNGSVISRRTKYLLAGMTDGDIQISDIINCALNDTLRIQVSTSAVTPSIVSSNFDNFLSISKLN